MAVASIGWSFVGFESAGPIREEVHQPRRRLPKGVLFPLMVNFTAGGFDLAFLFPLLGFLVVLLRGAWTSVTFTLGRAALPVAVVAAVWAVLQFLNIAWPRPTFEQRYLDWSVWIGVVVLGVIGAAILASVRARILGTSVADDLDAS